MVMGVDVSEPQKVSDLVALLDVDGDGEVELHEFLQRMKQVCNTTACDRQGRSRLGAESRRAAEGPCIGQSRHTAAGNP